MNLEEQIDDDSIVKICIFLQICMELENENKVETVSKKIILSSLGRIAPIILFYNTSIKSFQVCPCKALL